jgi:tetratricopeptide (TPR) repeat protein
MREAERRDGWRERARALVRRVSLVVLLGTSLSETPPPLDCAAAAKRRPLGVIVTTCRDEYARTGDPRTGARLAGALVQVGREADAAALANDLLVTPARGIAYRILGEIAWNDGRTDDAVTALEAARDLHRAGHERDELARDDQTLARVLSEEERYAEALQVLDEGITEAHAAGDRTIELYCRLSAARVLSQVGIFALAHDELEAADALTTTDRDRAWLEFERGNLDQEIARLGPYTGFNAQAVQAFKRARDHAHRAQLSDLALLTELNLAFSNAELGRTDVAEQHLAAAKLLDLDDEHAVERTAIEARIAYHRGQLSLASVRNDDAYARMEDGDDRIDVAIMQTRIALAGDDLGGAEAWARRAVAQVEGLRAAQTALELRPWVLSTRREPYELLFVALARQGRGRDALIALDRWQARTLLDALAEPAVDPSIDLRAAAHRVERLGAWLPIVSAAPAVPIDDPARTTAALANLDLLALVVADGRLWRLTALRAAIDVADLGTVAALQPQLDAVIAAPTDAAVTAELGARVLPDAMMQPTRAPLHLLLDGPTAALPIAALRHRGVPLAAIRPVIRVLGVPRAPCVDIAPRGRAIAIADADRNLDAAAEEATAVAKLLGGDRFVGAEATSERLFATAPDAVLHLAVHADVNPLGGVLDLFDRDVSALEISARKLGPSLVVLSACGSARAADIELAGSLATAFLAAGSRQVVATLRPVSDVGAREVATRFYEAGGADDPVRALAEVQAALAGTSNRDWPNFAVYGQARCSHP